MQRFVGLGIAQAFGDHNIGHGKAVADEVVVLGLSGFQGGRGGGTGGLPPP